MKKDNFKTDVIFRRFPEDNEIIVLFPHELWDNRGGIISYMHIGQHGEAEYSACMKNTKPAKENEYMPLYKELESVGYNLNVIKKRNYKRYLAEYYKMKEKCK